MTFAEFAQKVDNEGLSYSILHYFGSSPDIEDAPEGFLEEWESAWVSLGRIETWLYASHDKAGRDA